MSEMIERVALAMIEKSKARRAGINLINRVMMDGDEDFMALARAAIAAMREPTPNMVHVVAANWGRRTWSEYNEVIDAALQEQTP